MLDLWLIKRVNPQAMIHLAEKPVELAVRALAQVSIPSRLSTPQPVAVRRG